MNIDEDKLKVAKWIFEFYDKKTIKQIYNLLLVIITVIIIAVSIYNTF